MRWGLIARSETDRGLGIQTKAMFDNLSPDTTLVVIVPGSGFASHPENYPGATVVKLDNHSLDEQIVRDWWSGLDAVVSVETLYDWRLVEWAKADGVRTIVHGNPEFWMASNPQPDVWWWPTKWRLDKLPKGLVVPVPVEHREPVAGPLTDSYLRAVHIAGNAMHDRNGTGILLNAMRQVPKGVKLHIYHQTPMGKNFNSNIRHLGAVNDRWTMYDGQHVLVLPRRYGGLCLPALEAMACGVVPIMPNCSPNYDWPVYTVEGDYGRHIQMQGGTIETYDAYSTQVANALKNFASDLSRLDKHRERVREWVEQNTWDALEYVYHVALSRSCS